MKSLRSTITVIAFLAILGGIARGSFVECCISEEACAEDEYGGVVVNDRMVFQWWAASLVGTDEVIGWRDYHFDGSQSDHLASSCPDYLAGPDISFSGNVGLLKDNLKLKKKNLGRLGADRVYEIDLLRSVVRRYPGFADVCRNNGMLAMESGDTNFYDLNWTSGVITDYIYYAKNLALSGKQLFKKAVTTKGYEMTVPYVTLFVEGDYSDGTGTAAAASDVARVVVINCNALNYIRDNKASHLIQDSSLYPDHASGAALLFVLTHELAHIIGVGGEYHHESNCEGELVIGDSNPNHCAFISSMSVLGAGGVVWPGKWCTCCWESVSDEISVFKRGKNSI